MRLMQVIAKAELTIYKQPFVFNEFPVTDFRAKADTEALAIVRDGQICSQLVRADKSDGELFKIFSFHFADGLDNSGFVGWLASHIKQRTGSGVFVICGQNSGRGGIFDYWGCPIEVADPVMREVTSLIAQAK